LTFLLKFYLFSISLFNRGLWYFIFSNLTLIFFVEVIFLFNLTLQLNIFSMMPGTVNLTLWRNNRRKSEILIIKK
jgi:hypothetical protein